MPTEGDDDGLVLQAQDRGFGLFWPGGQIIDGIALSPLGDGLRIDAVAAGQGSQALLTMLFARRTAAVVVALP